MSELFNPGGGVSWDDYTRDDRFRHYQGRFKIDGRTADPDAKHQRVYRIEIDDNAKSVHLISVRGGEGFEDWDIPLNESAKDRRDASSLIRKAKAVAVEDNELWNGETDE